MKRNNYCFAAGLLNLFVAFLHLIGGQLDLINPLIESNLAAQAQAELIGAWHMVTLVLLASSWVLLRQGWKGIAPASKALVTAIGYLYLLFALPSLLLTLQRGFLVPQWILLAPIGALVLWGMKNTPESSAQ